MAGEFVHVYSGVKKDARAKKGVAIAIHRKNKKLIKYNEEIDEQIITMEIYKIGQNI